MLWMGVFVGGYCYLVAEIWVVVFLLVLNYGNEGSGLFFLGQTPIFYMCTREYSVKPPGSLLLGDSLVTKKVSPT